VVATVGKCPFKVKIILFVLKLPGHNPVFSENFCNLFNTLKLVQNVFHFGEYCKSGSTNEIDLPMQFNSFHLSVETRFSQTNLRFICSTIYSATIELINVKRFTLGLEVHVHDILYIYI